MLTCRCAFGKWQNKNLAVWFYDHLREILVSQAEQTHLFQRELGQLAQSFLVPRTVKFLDQNAPKWLVDHTDKILDRMHERILKPMAKRKCRGIPSSYELTCRHQYDLRRQGWMQDIVHPG
jgi:hypothetical protein